jgi:4-amino-4-deoxychorismate lyase
MCQLLESIYLNNGKFRNLDYHQERMNKSSQTLFGTNSPELVVSLANKIIPSSGLFKVRISYDTIIRSIELVEYQIKPITSLKLVYDNQISYDHKFSDRVRVEKLLEQRKDADEILIVKNGLITDASYANIIFKKENRWFTPNTYLLNGVMRQALLNNKSIEVADINQINFREYESCKLINAMLGINASEIPVEAIS